MSVDTTYIVNQFKLPHTVNVEVANVPDTLNVHLVDSVAQSNVDSLVAEITPNISEIHDTLCHIANSGSGYPEYLKVIAIPIILQCLVLATPLLLKAVSSVNDKGDRASIFGIILKHRKIYNVFIYALALGIILVFVYSIVFKCGCAANVIAIILMILSFVSISLLISEVYYLLHHITPTKAKEAIYSKKLKDPYEII